VNAVAKWSLIAVAGLFALALIATFGTMAFVFSIGTAVIPIRLDANVLHRDSKAPVARCLLAFEKGGLGLTRPATIDYGQTRERSDANGRLRVDSSYQYAGSMFWPFARERKPGFRFYLGEAPRYDTPDQVESWLVTLRFEEPWTKTEIAPALAVDRSLAHEEGRKQSGGFAPLPAEPAERLAQASVRFEDVAGGREAYVVALSLFLDEKQIAQCQATSLGDVEKSAADLFNSKRYAESLEAFREVARRKPDSAWAHRGAADCLDHLGKQREAIPSYRKASELAPKDLDHLYWYANSLINVQSREAVTQFQKLVGLEPDKARGFIGLGHTLWDLDRFAESVQAFEKAEKLCPTCLDEADRKAYKESRELAK